jgi:hypothetical protein
MPEVGGFLPDTGGRDMKAEGRDLGSEKVIALLFFKRRAL